MKNKNLTRIGDFVWTDYFLIILWANCKKSTKLHINILEDFKSIPFPYITFGLIIELYLGKVITEVGINQYMKRIYTLDSDNYNDTKTKTLGKSCLTWYGYFLTMPDGIEIDITISRTKLQNFIKVRLNNWELGLEQENSLDIKNIKTQKMIVGNKILRKIRLENLSRKNLVVPCNEFLEQLNEGDNLFVSGVNPFLVLYSFELDGLIQIVGNDNLDQLKVSIRSDIIIEAYDKILSSEVITQYGFTLPRNKETEGIYFNEKTGAVYKSSLLLGELKHNGKLYLFFKYLYDNQEIYKTFKEIGDSIGSIQEDIERGIPDLKSQLPLEIKKLIESGVGSYRLVSDDSVR